jgi:hypothetical protein
MERGGEYGIKPGSCRRTEALALVGQRGLSHIFHGSSVLQAPGGDGRHSISP